MTRRGLNETVPVKRSLGKVEDMKAMVWRSKRVILEYELTNRYYDDGNDGPSDLEVYNGNGMKAQLELSALATPDDN